MMGRSMLQRLRQISISSSLRGAFLMGALLTLIVSSVSLYSWHEQSSQIRYSLDEYFPRIHSAFLIEGNLNPVSYTHLGEVIAHDIVRQVSQKYA